MIHGAVAGNDLRRFDRLLPINFIKQRSLLDKCSMLAVLLHLYELCAIKMLN